MPNWFCDTGLASGANDGTSMDNAWKSLKTALQYASFADGDYLWIRRRSAFASASENITVGDSGTPGTPIYCIGWPRTTVGITSSDWTNGSASVVIDDGGMDREKHQARWITAPDGRLYVITRVVDANTIMIDREYVGSTVTNQAATIAADELYSIAQAIDDSTWTIKKTDWNGDALDLPVLDFENTQYYLYHGRRAWVYQGLEIKNGANGNYGSFSVASAFNIIRGCLFYQSQNTYSGQTAYGNLYDRCTFEGSGSGATQRGPYLGGYQTTILRNCAMYGFGDWGMRVLYGITYLENVNVGVEVANGDMDMDVASGATVVGYDVKFGGAVGVMTTGGSGKWDIVRPLVTIENFGKVLGTHYSMGDLTYLQKVDVVDGSGDPYKRSGGASSVLDIRSNNAYGTANRIDGGMRKAAEFRIWADTTSKSYRLYCQLANKASLSTDEIMLEARYVSAYDDTTEYYVSKAVSDETVSQRSGADDWSQYIEVTGVQLAVAGWVTLSLFVAWNDADCDLFIDPQVVIS